MTGIDCAPIDPSIVENCHGKPCKSRFSGLLDFLESHFNTEYLQKWFLETPAASKLILGGPWAPQGPLPWDPLGSQGSLPRDPLGAP